MIISDTTIAVIVATVPLTLTSIASLIVSIRNGGKSDSIAQKVDGTATKLQNDLANANGRIEQLLRFYPTPTPIGFEESPTEPTQVEIVNQDSQPVPTKPVKKP